jgi:hypothetical protein
MRNVTKRPGEVSPHTSSNVVALQPGFYRWLTRQVNRDGPVGEISFKVTCGTVAETYEEIVAGMREHPVFIDADFAALSQALREYQAWRRRRAHEPF